MGKYRARIPDAEAISALLKGLVGKETPCRDTKKEADTKGEYAVASYTLDGLQGVKLDAVATGDVPFVAFTGAALCMVPPSRAAESVEAGLVEEELKDDAHEVFNVLSTLFHDGDGATCRLTKIEYVAKPFPKEVASLTLGKSAHYELDVEGYGTGSVSIYLIE